VVVKLVNNKSKQSGRRANSRRNQKLEVRFADLNIRRKQTQGQRKAARKDKGTSNLRMTQVPKQVAMTIQNTTRQTTVRFCRTELIAKLSYDINSTGVMQEVPLNPVDPFWSQLQLGQMARLYGKFRFKSIRLTSANTAGTAVGGAMTMCYFENPDQRLTTADALISNDGAVMGPLWQPTPVVAKIVDRGKWYNIDPDSEEVMQTTQGKFVFGCVIAPTAENSVTVPIIADYEVEFAEPTLQSVPPATGRGVLAKSDIKAWGTGSVLFHFDAISPSQNADIDINVGYVASNPLWEFSIPFTVNDSTGSPQTAKFGRMRTVAGETAVDMDLWAEDKLADAKLSAVNPIGYISPSMAGGTIGNCSQQLVTMVN